MACVCHALLFTSLLQYPDASAEAPECACVRVCVCARVPPLDHIDIGAVSVKKSMPVHVGQQRAGRHAAGDLGDLALFSGGTCSFFQ